MEQGNPDVLLERAKRAAKQADRRAGRGQKRKRTLACNGLDRDSNVASTRKGADFFINWAKAHREVRTIQRRIAKAVREGKTLKTVLLAHESGLIKA